jgi:hypothetical protein
MLAYAGVCWRMLAYAHVRSRMLTYAQVYDSRQNVQRLPLVKKGVSHLFDMPTTLLAGDVKIEVLNLLALLVQKYKY